MARVGERRVARDVIVLGQVAARGAAMIELRCGRCDRHGRLSVNRPLARYGPDASLRDIMHEQIGSCPHRNDTQLYTRCNPYCPTLVELFGREPG